MEACRASVVGCGTRRERSRGSVSGRRSPLRTSPEAGDVDVEAADELVDLASMFAGQRGGPADVPADLPQEVLEVVLHPDPLCVSKRLREVPGIRPTGSGTPALAGGRDRALMAFSVECDS